MATASLPTASKVRRKLGRGLGSLISSPVRVEVPPSSLDRDAPVHSQSEFITSGSSVGAPNESLDLQMVPVDAITPNPRQPRQHFDQKALGSLAESIRVSGLMQPIIVRQTHGRNGQSSGGYQLVAGERRWRAAQAAGLQRIPALVRDIDDQTAAELSLVENLQREDLNPMERAEAFRRLVDEFGLTHQEIAERVGLDRSSVTNHLRLNDLDAFVKDAVRSGGLSQGHAKVLLATANLKEQAALAAQALRHGWTVRELERRAKQPGSSSAPAVGRLAATASPHMADLEKRLSGHLGTKVRLRPGRTKGAGKLIIEFFTLDQFEGLMRQMQFQSD